jgi:hypothetical protein
MRFSHRLGYAIFMAAVLVGLGGTVQAATNYSVKNANDSGTDSLRDAITQSNSNGPGINTIIFTHNYSINLLSALPAITVPVIINASTPQNVVISGSGMTLLTVNANGTQLHNMAFINGDVGISLSANNCLVQSCRIGTDWSDSVGEANAVGIQITGAGNTLSGNVISGNQTGISCSGHYNHISGNWIGTNSAGTAKLPNANIGIDIPYPGFSNLIDGGNIISGNNNGIFIEAYTICNTVCGNYIGTNSSGLPLGNSNNGLWVEGDHNCIGMPFNGGANQICFNKEGVLLNAPYGGNNFVCNNYIGTNPGGSALGNTEYGIQCTSQNNLIGGMRGSGLYNSNVIAANAVAGVFLAGDNNTVCGNYIGCNAAGTVAQSNGIGIYVQSSNNLLGGLNPGGINFYGNIIAGNSNQGINLSGGLGNVAVGNYIGFTDSGVLANTTGVLINGAMGTVIGGFTSGERNVISGNGDGLTIQSPNQIVRGNYFGTDANGAVQVNNLEHAIWLKTAAAMGCLIGGPGVAERNVICGAQGNTLVMLDTASSGNTLVGNYVGLLANQQLPSGSVYAGIGMFNGSHDNSVGLKSTHTGNLIVGGTQGVYLSGTLTKDNGVYGNTICGFASFGTTLSAGANLNQAPPVITGATNLLVHGTSAHTGDLIEVFLASRGAGLSGGSLRYLGSATAAGPNFWSVDVSGQGVNLGDYVCALASDSANNTSPFSNNVLLAIPTATATFTPTPTISATPTISVTSTVTQTPTPPATATVTPTVTQSPVSLASNLDVETAAFPNPASKLVNFGFKTTQTGAITIRVYNTRFRLVKEIKDATTTGLGSVPWDVSDVSPGIYFYQIVIGTHKFSNQKLVIAR